MGQRRAPQDPQSVPGHAQLKHLQDPRRPLESDVQRAKAALLRGAIPSLQTSHGATPRLPLPPAPQTHLHRRRQKDAHLRVQIADAQSSPRNASTLVSRRQRFELHGRDAVAGTVVGHVHGQPAAHALPQWAHDGV